MGTPYPSRAHYMMAQIKIMLGKNKEAVIELDKAFHAGMSDYSRILNDTVFDKLKGNKRFENLIKEMDTLN